MLSGAQLFATPWSVDPQAPLFMGFSWQEYWSRLLFLFPGDLSNPGIKPGSPALQAEFLLSELPHRKSQNNSVESEKLKNSISVTITPPHSHPQILRELLDFHNLQYEGLGQLYLYLTELGPGFQIQL